VSPVARSSLRYGQYRVPKSVIPAGGTLTIVSTNGTNRTEKDGNLVQYANWGDVWNNSGDTAILIDGKRKVIDTCRYKGDDSRKARC